MVSQKAGPILISNTGEIRSNFKGIHLIVTKKEKEKKLKIYFRKSFDT